METVHVRSHVGEDGMLTLRLPVAARDTDLDVVIVMQSVGVQAAPTAAGRSWPEGFFEQTAGSFADEPLERAPQPEAETREVVS